MKSGKIIPKQNQKLNKEEEIIKDKQTEILELKNPMNEMKKKNATESIYSRIDQTEDRISNLKDSQKRILEKEERKPM